MKKRVLLPPLAMAALMAAMPSVPAVADTTSDEIYDFSGFNDVSLINIFTTAYMDGRKYPTEAEFASIGILPSDIAFIRSHVRNKGILSRADRLLKDTYETRNLWMNIPMDRGKDNTGGQPNNVFSSDVFSMWNYTNIFGSWNHSFFTAAGSWVDAAHKNGTDIYSGIKFFDTTGNPGGVGAGSWMNFCTATDNDGNFKYVEPIINCLMYFGADGINYNWEDSGYSDDDITAFHKALYKKAAENGFDNFHAGIYTSVSQLTDYTANCLFGNDEGRTFDLMLNYSGGDFSWGIAESARAAEKAMGTTDGLYTGVWIVTMDRKWSRLNQNEDSKKVGVCLWGEHSQSRFWSYNSGADVYEQQANYQSLLERAMSGGNRNPLDRPAVSDTGNNWEQEGTKKPLQTYAGLATWIPERSSIFGNLPFATNFNLGNGDRYAYKGKRTAGSWYNMGTQDYVPTYRWLVVKPGTQTVSTDIDAQFTHADQYIGGTSLLLTGKATTEGTDVVLYKTDLNISAGNPFVKVAVKNGKEGTNASSLYVIVEKADGSWAETPVGDISGANWEEKKLALNGVAQSDVIKHIGLRVKGDDANYKLYVGKLELNDDIVATPANIKTVNVEVKNETKNSLTAKVYWNVDAVGSRRAAWDLVYNDEANIDHFEVFYKNGENGKVSEVGRTTSWATIVPDLQFEGEADEPYIGVRSVSTDLKSYSPVEWVKVTRGDYASLPEPKEDEYPVSQLDPNADGVATAQKTRFVTDATTTGAEVDLAFHGGTAIADGTNYCDATDHVIKMRQGQTIDLFLKANDASDGLKYCFVGAWLDLNGDHNFDPNDITENPETGERLFKFGEARHSGGYPEIQNPGKTWTFTVPNDAKPGKSRLRVVYSDLWFEGAFLPSGYTSKGYTIDFGVEIVGDNPGRGAGVDIHDQGEAEEPENLNGTIYDNINSAHEGVSKVDATDGKWSFENVEAAWVYDASGVLVKYLVRPTSFDAQQLANGVYLVKMQNGNIIRSQKLVK